jgi:hypothetical protein
MPNLAAAHWKRVERGKFGQKICYLAKSPCKEYSIGKYTEGGKDGEPRYKHNKRDIRPGTRVKLFLISVLASQPPNQIRAIARIRVSLQINADSFKRSGLGLMCKV